jgi:hypothetical protein
MPRADDESITGETYLLRALRCSGWWTIENERVRASSLAFFDGYSGETSCHFDTQTSRAMSISRFPNCPVARFTAAQARDCGFILTRDPEGDPENPVDHVLLILAQADARRKVYQGACKRLAMQSEVLSSANLASDFIENDSD